MTERIYKLVKKLLDYIWQVYNNGKVIWSVLHISGQTLHMGPWDKNKMWKRSRNIFLWYEISYTIICQRHENKDLRFNILWEISRSRLISHKILKHKCSLSCFDKLFHCNCANFLWWPSLTWPDLETTASMDLYVRNWSTYEVCFLYITIMYKQ